MVYSGSGGHCNCAGCNLKRLRERDAEKKAIAEFQAAIDRGDFDYLQPKSNEIEGQ